MVHQKYSGSLYSVGQCFYARANGSTHPLLIFRIKDEICRIQRRRDFILMMTDDNNRRIDTRAFDSIEHMLEEGLSPEFQKRFRMSSHALGFAGSEYDCSDQWDNAYMKVLTATR
jgi:hypothetical protein